MAALLTNSTNRAFAPSIVVVVGAIDVAANGLAVWAYLSVYGLVGTNAARSFWRNPTTTVVATIVGVIASIVAVIAGTKVLRRRDTAELLLFALASVAIVATGLILLTNSGFSSGSGLPGDF